MADVNLRDQAVLDRGIRLTDLLVGFDLGQTDAQAAARADTLAQVAETLRTLLREVPDTGTTGWVLTKTDDGYVFAAGSGLTPAQAAAIASNTREIGAIGTTVANNRLGLASLEGRFDTLAPDNASLDTQERYLAGALRNDAEGNPQIITYWDVARQIPIAGRVNHVLTKIGENDGDYAFRDSGVAAEIVNRRDGDDPRRITVADTAEMATALATQSSSNRPLFIEITAAFAARSVGDVLYVPPTSQTVLHLFTLPVPSESEGQTAAQVDEKIAAHTRDEDAHHAPPDVSGLAAQSDVEALETRVADVERDSLIEPDYWINGNSDARTYVVHIHAAGIPTGARQIRFTVGGTNLTQTLVADDTDYSFDVGASIARSINQNLRGATTIYANVRYLNSAGDTLATERILLRVVPEAPSTGGGDSTPPAFASFPITSGTALPSTVGATPANLTKHTPVSYTHLTLPTIPLV